LKTAAGVARLDSYLEDADLLVTSNRPRALARLGLDWPAVHRRFPLLCQIAIIGYVAPESDQPGHDLTYQARAGLLAPPELPRTCLADLAGALETVTAALGVLMEAERTGEPGYVEVSLAEAANTFAAPLRHGLTASAGPLGGAHPGYQLYPALQGWLAVAALEPHFLRDLCRHLEISEATYESLADAFATRTASQWEAWATERDLPIVAVCPPVLAVRATIPQLRERLLAMAAEDQSARAEFAADGSLFQGYDPRMARIHNRNAAALARILDEHGWPSDPLVGEDGAYAAWLILQHAIANPPLQRRGLELLKAATESGQAPAWQSAYLEDRIRVMEGRPQVYGTQFDWDQAGEMSPVAIENLDAVDERRRLVGLEPLAEAIERQRQNLAQSNERRPTDWSARQREMDKWARSIGWRGDS
jgi:hypothetical protein